MATSRTRLLILGLVSIVITSLILYTSLGSRSYWPTFQAQDSSRTLSQSADQDAYKLHPEDHVFREAGVLRFTWNITSGLRRPDGVLKRVYLINGAFPGPTIEAREGDRIVVDVFNGLENEAVSIHWHGLSMRGANHMDGAVGVTQSPIQPGHSFTYNYTTHDQHGTFWYHAHDGVQRADGFYGALVLHKPGTAASTKDLPDEYLLLLGDWYHQSAEVALEKYMHPGAFGIETVPDSILVNGRGVYNCSNAVPARPVDCNDHPFEHSPVLNLDVDQDLILRVINVGAYAGLSLGFDSLVLTPMTVDGGHAVAQTDTRSAGFMHPGERITFRARSTSDDLSFSEQLTITLDEKPFKYQNPALTLKQQFPVDVKSLFSGSKDFAKPLESIDVQQLTSAFDQFDVLPKIADHTVVLYAITQKLAHLENEPHGFINHTTWKPQSDFLLSSTRQSWNDDQFVPAIQSSQSAPQWVDIIINNLDEEGHPFHLHGYDFWVLTTFSSTRNWGSYNPYEDSEPPGGTYDLKNAVKRDTVYVPRRGYAVLRFKADNPGIWMFHCHVLWHLASGMAMAFEIKDG